MAENKKSFLMYVDNQPIFDGLTNEEAGILIKHIYKYVSDNNPDNLDNRVINMAFLHIKTQLKRDLKSWESKIKQRSEAGKRSAESRSTKSTTVESRSTKSTVNVNDNVNVNVNVNDIKEKNIKKKIEVLSKVFLFEHEILKAKEFFGEKYDQALEILSNYKNSSGKRYKSDYHTLRGWVLKELNKQPVSKIDSILSAGNEAINYFKNKNHE